MTVDLEGKASSEWKHSFEDTVRLLGGGDWGRVRVKKGAVHVEAVVPGEEDKVRFFLESVVEQANATQRASESEDSSEPTTRTAPAASTPRWPSGFARTPPPRSSRQTEQPSDRRGSEAADLDHAVAVANLKRRLRCRCRPVLDRAVPAVEAGAMAGADDLLTVDLAVAE